ncbi:MAG: NAD-dependent epimerase/dehydratase family protein [Clostridia bacterium]|nr:NAD-dependent epimerase/dehydratase family protein [Clostridia bacterium]
MRIILTGKNSYISSNICNYLLSHGFDAECISIRNGVDGIDLRGADAIIHCAAIVHKRESDYKDEYDKVNYELTKALADKAVKYGVKHFVFLSTMAVYGVTEGKIDKFTKTEPKTLYGKSKLKAEKYLLSLKSDSFRVTIVRPPMVYGKDCPGNYAKLSKIAKIIPVIPDTANKKSLIYIGNLSLLIRDIIEKNEGGIFMPMDNEYVSTADLMRYISKKPCSKILGKALKALPFGIIKKAFGTLYYGEDIAARIDNVSVKEAVRLSER